MQLDNDWGWPKGRRRITLSHEAVKDIVLNCKKGEEAEYAKKYNISLGYTTGIRAGRCRKREYREIKGIGE